MPLKSKAQQGWMFANHPAMAREWAAHTPNIASLPEHVGDKKKKHKKKAETISDILSEIFSKDAMLSLGGSLTSAASSPSPSDSPAPSHASQGQPGAQSDKARSFFSSITPSRGSAGVNSGKTDKRITSLFGYIPGSSPYPKQKQAEDGEAGGILSGLGSFPVSSFTTEKLAGRFDGLSRLWRMPAHMPITPHTAPLPHAPSVPLVPHTPPTAHLPSIPEGHVPTATPAAAPAHTPAPAVPEGPAGAGGRVAEVPVPAPSPAPPTSPSSPSSPPAPLPHATQEIPLATHATSPSPAPTSAPTPTPPPTSPISAHPTAEIPTARHAPTPSSTATAEMPAHTPTSPTPAPSAPPTPTPAPTSPPPPSLPGGWDWFTHPLGTAAQRYLPEASFSLPGAAMGVARGAAHTGDFLINLLTGKGSTQNMVQGVNQSLRGNGQPSLSNYLRGFGYGAAGVGLPLFGAAARGERPDLSEAALAGMSANATGLRLPWDTLHGLHGMLPEHLQVPPESSMHSMLSTPPESRHANPFAATMANARDFGSILEAAPGALTSEVRRAQIAHGLGGLTRLPAYFGTMGGGQIAPQLTQIMHREDQAYRTRMGEMADRILADPNADPAERRRAMPYATRPGLPGAPSGIQGGAGPQGFPPQPQGGGEPSVPPEVAQRQQSISMATQALRQGNLPPQQRQAIQNQLHQEIVSLAMPNIAAQTAQSAAEILSDVTSGTGVVTAVGLTNLSQNLHDMGFRNAPQQAQGLWQGMNDAQKWALVAGLGIAAAGLFSAFQGHGGMGALMGLGGLGAAAYGLTGGQPFSGQAWGNVFRGQSPNPQRPGPLQLVPGAGALGQAISRIGPKPQDPFGMGIKSPTPPPSPPSAPTSTSPPPISSTPTPAPTSSPSSPSTSPPTPSQVVQNQVRAAHQALAGGNVQQGAQIAAQIFRSSPQAMEAYRQLGQAFSAPSLFAPNDADIAARSQGLLTPEAVAALRANWAEVQAAVGQ